MRDLKYGSKHVNVHHSSEKNTEYDITENGTPPSGAYEYASNKY